MTNWAHTDDNQRSSQKDIDAHQGNCQGGLQGYRDWYTGKHARARARAHTHSLSLTCRHTGISDGGREGERKTGVSEARATGTIKGKQTRGEFLNHIRMCRREGVRESECESRLGEG